MTTAPQHRATNCPFCGSDSVSVRSDATETVKIGRKKVTVQNLVRSVCTACGKSFATPAQHDANIAAIRKARLELTPISPKEIRLVRARLGISQADAQRMFAGGKNAFSKYERGEVAPSLASARLMKAAITVPGVAKHLAEEAGVQVNPAWESIPERRALVRVPVARRQSESTYDDLLGHAVRLSAEIDEITKAKGDQPATPTRARLYNPPFPHFGAYTSETFLRSVAHFVVSTPALRRDAALIERRLDEYVVEISNLDDTSQLVAENAQRQVKPGTRARKSRSNG